MSNNERSAVDKLNDGIRTTASAVWDVICLIGYLVMSVFIIWAAGIIPGFVVAAYYNIPEDPNYAPLQYSIYGWLGILALVAVFGGIPGAIYGVFYYCARRIDKDRERQQAEDDLWK